MFRKIRAFIDWAIVLSALGTTLYGIGWMAYDLMQFFRKHPKNDY